MVIMMMPLDVHDDGAATTEFEPEAEVAGKPKKKRVCTRQPTSPDFCFFYCFRMSSMWYLIHLFGKCQCLLVLLFVSPPSKPLSFKGSQPPFSF